MFTWVSSDEKEILFGAELRKIVLREVNSTNNMYVSIYISHKRKKRHIHVVHLGLFAKTKDLMDGLTSLNCWANSFSHSSFVTVSKIIEHLEIEHGCKRIGK